MRTTVCPPHHPPTYAKKKKRNKLRVTERRLNGRALRTASPSPSQLSRRQWHTPALLLFEGTSSFQSAALQLCDSAAPSPRRCTPLLPRPPLQPTPAPLLLPVQSLFQAHSPAPNASRAGQPTSRWAGAFRPLPPASPARSRRRRTLTASAREGTA